MYLVIVCIYVYVSLSVSLISFMFTLCLPWFSLSHMLIIIRILWQKFYFFFTSPCCWWFFFSSCLFVYIFWINKNNSDKFDSKPDVLLCFWLLLVLWKRTSTRMWVTERCSDTGKIFHCDNEKFWQMSLMTHWNFVNLETFPASKCFMPMFSGIFQTVSSQERTILYLYIKWFFKFFFLCFSLSLEYSG